MVDAETIATSIATATASVASVAVAVAVAIAVAKATAVAVAKATAVAVAKATASTVTLAIENLEQRLYSLWKLHLGTLEEPFAQEAAFYDLTDQLA